MIRVDLNADVGEGVGADAIGADPGLMPHITSANVACGFHAGDPGTMRSAILLALRHHVAVGAHPAFPDIQGFGRREMQMSARDVENLVTYQIGALAAMAGAEGVGLQHVKPHGALFNMAARDSALAGAIARATAAVDRGLILFGLPGSQLIAARVPPRASPIARIAPTDRSCPAHSLARSFTTRRPSWRARS